LSGFYQLIPFRRVMKFLVDIRRKGDEKMQDCAQKYRKLSINI